jgi:transposase
MVDRTRDRGGQVRARLLDLVLGRLGPSSAAWLDDRQSEFQANIRSAVLDPFRGFASASRDSIPDAVQVLDARLVVKLGTRVQQQPGRRGHRDHPLYKIRGPLRHDLAPL